MYFLRKKQVTPAIQMFSSDGKAARLHVTFRNGEIHINADQMPRGSYQLRIEKGPAQETRQITVE